MCPYFGEWCHRKPRKVVVIPLGRGASGRSPIGHAGGEGEGAVVSGEGGLFDVVGGVSS